MLATLRTHLGRMAALEAKIDKLTAELDRSRSETALLAQDTSGQLARIQDILQLIYDREPEFRERLRELRQSTAYEQAFEEGSPLISVIIPTYDRGDLLVSRALPSVLAQTYERFEIVVVGDCAPPETARWIAELADSRIRYENLSYRGPYPERPRDLWHVAGIPARNTAVALAQGRWIAPLDDDDAFHPQHIERLLWQAQTGRHEVAYGQLRCLMSDGSEFPLGAFPPEYGQFGWQGAIFHAGLRFFEMELADALFSSPADWSLCRRMLRAGVRFGMLDEVVTDHYESRFGADHREPSPEPRRA
jgi:glycosyltransferase involved in cell wall biosynthesis